MKPRERETARELRRQGVAMKEIARRVQVSVGSVSLWTRDIELTPAQLEAIAERDRRSPNRRRGTAERSARARAVREEAQEHGRGLARAKDPLHLAGCMLFWAEGSKQRNSVAFCNSDVAMHQHFVRFLRECYDVPDDRIRLSVNCHLGNGLSLEEIERWWLDQLCLTGASLRAAVVNRASRATKFRRNTLLYGTVKVAVHSTFITQSIYGAIQEYTGIDRPEWLDCLPPAQLVRPLGAAGAPP